MEDHQRAIPSAYRMSGEFEVIRERVREGKYLVRSHAVVHALKEGFDRTHIVDAVLQGKIVEEYPEDERVLVCVA